MLKHLAIIGTYECRELFDGNNRKEIPATFLVKSIFLKYSQRKKLEQLSFPSKQIEWIVNKIFGNPFVQEKEGLIQSESQEEFDNRYKKFKNKWIKIERDYTIRNGEDFVTYSKIFKNSLR